MLGFDFRFGLRLSVRERLGFQAPSVDHEIMENAVTSKFGDLPAVPIFASPYTQLKRGEINAMGRFALLQPIDICCQAPSARAPGAPLTRSLPLPAPRRQASITNSKYQRRLPDPGSFGPENSGNGGKSAEHTEKIPAGVMGSFGVSRPFPRVPRVPLSNYNHI